MPTLSETDTQACALLALLGAVYCMGRALDIALDAAIAFAQTQHVDVVHHRYIHEGSRTVLTFFHRNGSGVERTTDFMSNCTIVHERTFPWRRDDRGVPREWVRS